MSVIVVSLLLCRMVTVGCVPVLSFIFPWTVGRLSQGRLFSEGTGQESPSASPAPRLQWAHEYESGSDSDAERPDPDLVLDDLASRRFHSPSPAAPVNFAVPVSPKAGGGPEPTVTLSPNVAPQPNVTGLRSESDLGVAA